ncbi:hypothetical protein RND71_019115 [Anisodus tanguticus]|uniref:Uncharacterized protein n=1 Tax=Anisodus tanguticus TaxID=243964 RepID=A0AAE1RYE2_9SOLA|nr:hypothetical protein RND71_019115 [Anisodus tanguticus]
MDERESSPALIKLPEIQEKEESSIKQATTIKDIEVPVEVPDTKGLHKKLHFRRLAHSLQEYPLALEFMKSFRSDLTASITEEESTLVIDLDRLTTAQVTEEENQILNDQAIEEVIEEERVLEGHEREKKKKKIIREEKKKK